MTVTFSVSTYVDPGVYIQEVLVPGQINVAGQPLTVCLVGAAARVKRARNEVVIRGLIEGESFTGDAGMAASPYQGTLQYHGTRDLDNTTVYRNGVALPDSQVSYPRATATGSNAGTFDLSTNNAVGLELDGQDAVTVVIRPAASSASPDTLTGTASAQDFSVLYAIPNTPDTLTFTMSGAGWDGGDITIRGRDATGASADETIVAGTLNGAGPHTSSTTWSHVSSIRTTAGGTGISGETVTVGWSTANQVAAQPIYNTGGALERYLLNSEPYDDTSATLYVSTAGTIGAMTRAQVAAAINAALGSSVLGAARGYGPNYATVAADVTTGVSLTSPVTTASNVSDVRIFAPVANGAHSTIFGTAVGRAPTVIQIADASYVAGSTWTVDYIADDDDEASSTIASLTNGATVTLTSAGTPFTTADVGKYITVTGCANAVNNGRFLVLSAPSSSTLTFTNVSGVAEGAVGSWSLEPRSDSLANAATAIVAVGSYAGTNNFAENDDFELTGGVVDWSYPASVNQSSVTGTSVGSAGTPGNYNLTAAPSATAGTPDADHIRVTVDNLTSFDLNLSGIGGGTGAPADRIPLGYIAYGALNASKNNADATDVVTNINALMSNHPSYGPRRYRAVASETAGENIVLTSPTRGRRSYVAVQAVAGSGVGDAASELFGRSTAVGVAATGTAPSAGTAYFVSYDYARPATDYNVVKQHFSLDQALAEVGEVALDNPLAIAAELAFLNGAPTLTTIQIDNAANQPGFGDGSGDPILSEVQAALDGAARSSTPTEIVLVGSAGTPLAHQVELLQHVETQTGPLEKNYRRGWYGMARGTQIGDKNTADTLVFRAARTLQYASASPGRGRAILVGPPQLAGVTRTLQLSDGTTVRNHPLDSTYLAVACAARLTSFVSVAEPLVRKTLRGFDLDTLTNPILKAERHRLASNGVLVVTLDAGRLILLDPISTERAGGARVSLEQIQCTAMRDNVSRKVDLALDTNIIGIVPTDLATFIIDIKSIIASVITGEISNGSIGPYQDASGASRSIDLTTDIEVEQNANDPTKYSFRYFYNLRYPALRLFGQYSVDNPFFA